MPIGRHGVRKALSSTLTHHDHVVWITDDILEDAFRRFIHTKRPRGRRGIGHVPGPLEFQRRPAIDRRRNSICYGGQDLLLPPVQNLEIATYNWLKRLWDPKAGFTGAWQPPKISQHRRCAAIDPPLGVQVAQESAHTSGLAAQGEARNERLLDRDCYPLQVSLEQYMAYLKDTNSIADVRKLHWQLGASRLDQPSQSSLAAFGHLFNIGCTKQDMIDFSADPALNACNGPLVPLLVKNFGFCSLTVADRVALLLPWLETGNLNSLCQSTARMSWSSTVIGSAVDPAATMAQMLLDTDGMFAGLRRRLTSSTASERLTALETFCSRYIFGDMNKFPDQLGVFKAISAFMQHSTASVVFAQELCTHTPLLTHVANHILTRMSACDAAHLLSNAPKPLADAVSFTYLSKGRLTDASDLQERLKIVSPVLRILEQPPMEDSPLALEIYTRLSKYFKAKHLLQHFAALKPKAAIATLFQHWIEDKWTRAVNANANPKAKADILEPILRVLERADMPDCSSVSAIYTTLAQHFAPGQLMAHWQGLAPSRAIMRIFKFWIEPDLMATADGSRLIFDRYTPASPAWAEDSESLWNTETDDPPRPSSLYGHYAKEHAGIMEQAPEMQPMLKAMLVEACFSLSSSDQTDTASAAANRVLSSLLESRRYSAFLWYACNAKKFWKVSVNPAIIKPFIEATMTRYPRLALSGYFLSKKIHLESIPDLLFHMFPKDKAVMGTAKAISPLGGLRSGLLPREHRIDIQCSLSRRMTDMLNQLALHIATQARLSPLSAHEAVWYLWQFLRSRSGPVDTRFSQAAVLAAVASRVRARRNFTHAHAMYALRVVHIVDGPDVADELDVLLWTHRTDVHAMLTAYAKLLERNGITVHFDADEFAGPGPMSKAVAEPASEPVSEP